MTWLTVALAGLTALGGGSGLWAALTVGATRRKITAEADEANAGAVRTIIGGATDSVKLLRQLLDDAEVRVERVNAELRLARAQVDELSREAEHAFGEVRRLRMAILEPGTTLEQLRAMVDPPPLSSGRP